MGGAIEFSFSASHAVYVPQDNAATRLPTLHDRLCRFLMLDFPASIDRCMITLLTLALVIRYCRERPLPAFEYKIFLLSKADSHLRIGLRFSWQCSAVSSNRTGKRSLVMRKFQLLHSWYIYTFYESDFVDGYLFP